MPTELGDIMKKAMLTGIGLALKGKDEVEAFFKDMEKQLNTGEQDGRKFFDDFRKNWDDAQENLEDRIEKAVRNIMKKADVVTMDELKALKKEIRELKKAIGKDSEPTE